VPTLINAGYQERFFWDGRADSLEAQVQSPIENPIEMGLPMEQLVDRLNEIAGYRQQFQQVFDGKATPERITQALASFVRTILSGNAPYDHFRAGDLAALSPAAQRGHDVFFFRANCAACHRGPNFTDGQFHNLGIGMDQPEPDLGRFVVTRNELDRGAFKTPTLREIARTAPYMHDGRFKTLKDVVEHYSRGGFNTPNTDGLINALPLSEQEKADLVTFLKVGLTSESYPEVELPVLPKD
jgi:cytochrome c peroxidase